MPEDREVAGIRCMQVLAELGDYIDGELASERRSQIDAHLEGCTWCAQFGGRYANVVGQLQASREEIAPTLNAELLWKARGAV
ncbi:MAG: zf-HC2 domain-containing protein [bacterium]